MAECNCCSNGVTLLYACSGAANTCLLADHVARKIMKDGCGKMPCLAAIGAGLSGFLESAKAANKNIVINGCPVACGKKVFDKNNILPIKHFILTDYEVEKGKIEITETIINEVASKLKAEM